MIASSAVPLYSPLGVVLSEDGDEHVDIIPANAWRDESGLPETDENSNPVLS